MTEPGSVYMYKDRVFQGLPDFSIQQIRFHDFQVQASLMHLVEKFLSILLDLSFWNPLYTISGWSGPS